MTPLYFVDSQTLISTHLFPNANLLIRSDSYSQLQFNRFARSCSTSDDISDDITYKKQTLTKIDFYHNVHNVHIVHNYGTYTSYTDIHV